MDMGSVKTTDNEALWHSVIDFWFTEINPKNWFVKDAEFDELVKTEFGVSVAAALKGDYDYLSPDYTHNDKTATRRLALIILLDQMPRNIFRNTPEAFAGDARALALSHEAVRQGQLDIETKIETRQFLLMPYMHSEDIGVHNRAIELFEKYTSADTLAFEHKHKDIIARFGRYPHRNAILGRTSTIEEIAFLKTENSGF